MALAQRHHGVVTHVQLVGEGLTRHQIGLRITDGRLRVLHRGVYLVGAVKRTLRAGIEVRHADIAIADRRRRHSMNLTSPPRTVLDCASVIQDAYEVEALISEAQYRRLANKSEMELQLKMNPGKRGIAVVRQVLDLPGGPRRTRSRGERAFLRLLREERIAGYETNSKAFGPELDFVWPALKFAVEAIRRKT